MDIRHQANGALQQARDDIAQAEHTAAAANEQARIQLCSTGPRFCFMIQLLLLTLIDIQHACADLCMLWKTDRPHMYSIARLVPH